MLRFSCLRALPVNVRSRSGQRCSRSPRGDLRAHAPAWRTQVRRRGAVLRKSPPSEIGPPRLRPRSCPRLAISTRSERAYAPRRSTPLFAVHLPRPASANRGALLRRRALRSASRAVSLFCLRFAAPDANRRPPHRCAPSSRLCRTHRSRRTKTKFCFVLPGAHTGFTPYCPTIFGHRFDSMRRGHTPCEVMEL